MFVKAGKRVIANFVRHGDIYFWVWMFLRLEMPYSPQPDTSRSCKSTDTGLVCRVERLFSSQLAPVPIYTAWWTEAHVCEQLIWYADMIWYLLVHSSPETPATLGPITRRHKDTHYACSVADRHPARLQNNEHFILLYETQHNVARRWESRIATDDCTAWYFGCYNDWSYIRMMHEIPIL